MTTTNSTSNLENLVSNVETIFNKYKSNFRGNMLYSAVYCVELNKPLSSLCIDKNTQNIKQNNNLEEIAEFIYRLINDLNDYNPQKVFPIFIKMENQHYKQVQNLYRILFMFNEGIDQMKWPGPTQTEFNPNDIPSYTEADIDEVNNELYRLLNLESTPTEPFLLHHHEIEMVQKLKQKINEYNSLCCLCSLCDENENENEKLQIIKTYWEPVCFYDDTDCDVDGDGYESGYDSVS